MPETSPQVQESENTLQIRAKALRLAAAFQSVFGQERKRSEAQILVLDHLKWCASSDQNAYQFNSARDGVSLIAAGIHRDGANSILKVIDRQLSIAAQHKEPTKSKIETKR